MIRSYLEWVDITQHGTSGDQVHDILASWKADAYKWLEKNISLEQENARLKAEDELLAKEILDTAYSIIKACTYQDEPSAAAGRYGLPRACFDNLDKLIQKAHDIELPAPQEVTDVN